MLLPLLFLGLLGSIGLAASIEEFIVLVGMLELGSFNVGNSWRLLNVTVGGPKALGI